MTPILEKCITELKSDTPRIDYVLGMLETLVGMNPSTISIKPISAPPTPLATVVTGVAPSDEASILDAQAKAAIEAVKNITKASEA